jgi:hypothetical protein
MDRPPFSVAEAIRLHGAAYIRARSGRISTAHAHVIKDLVSCRTSALGGHADQCQECGLERISYNSCRNRHCPKCLAHRSAAWLDARREELLPVRYFHVVFTVPREVAALALGNKSAMYGLLFRAVTKTLKVIARDRLQARVGGLAVLHTWSQALEHHPHVHCVIPGGGISFDGTRWISSRPNFFLPIRVLSRYFRGAFLRGLDQLRAKRELRFGGSTTELAEDAAYARWRAAMASKEWVVYSKAPFGSPERVLKYLARYTHRVAISDRRIVEISDGRVSFRYRDAKRGDANRIMTLEGPEFVRRFLLHVQPKRFVRIRHFGFLGIRDRAANLAKCRELVGPAPLDRLPEGIVTDANEEPEGPADEEKRPERVCTGCGSCNVRRVVIDKTMTALVAGRSDTS